jgi:hypothetical protein
MEAACESARHAVNAILDHYVWVESSGVDRRENTTLDWRLPFGLRDQGYSTPSDAFTGRRLLLRLRHREQRATRDSSAAQPRHGLLPGVAAPSLGPSGRNLGPRPYIPCPFTPWWSTHDKSQTDYTQQLLAYLQAWRQYLEQAMAAAAPAQVPTTPPAVATTAGPPSPTTPPQAATTTAPAPGHPTRPPRRRRPRPRRTCRLATPGGARSPLHATGRSPPADHSRKACRSTNRATRPPRRNRRASINLLRHIFGQRIAPPWSRRCRPRHNRSTQVPPRPRRRRRREELVEHRSPERCRPRPKIWNSSSPSSTEPVVESGTEDVHSCGSAAVFSRPAWTDAVRGHSSTAR